MASKIDFGYQRVDSDTKARLVRGVFDSVASHYDLMNDLMSGGLHRLWKRFSIELGGLRNGQVVLDVASGSADLAMLAYPRVQPHGHVWVCDINSSMLSVARDRLIDRGMVKRIELLQADGEALPFSNGSIDRIFVGFGLRNMTDKARALRSMYRVLKPGGRLLVLEFSKLKLACLQPLYDRYLQVLPWLGKRIAADADSYRYLAESIHMHPDQNALQVLFESCGFECCDHYNLCAGVVAVHSGWRL